MNTLPSTQHTATDGTLINSASSSPPPFDFPSTSSSVHLHLLCLIFGSGSKILLLRTAAARLRARQRLSTFFFPAFQSTFHRREMALTILFSVWGFFFSLSLPCMKISGVMNSSFFRFLFGVVCRFFLRSWRNLWGSGFSFFFSFGLRASRGRVYVYLNRGVFLRLSSSLGSFLC